MKTVFYPGVCAYCGCEDCWGGPYEVEVEEPLARHLDFCTNHCYETWLQEERARLGVKGTFCKLPIRSLRRA